MLSRVFPIACLLVATTFAAGAAAQDGQQQSKPTKMAPRSKALPRKAPPVDAPAEEDMNGSGQDDVAGPEEAGDELFEPDSEEPPADEGPHDAGPEEPGDELFEDADPERQGVAAPAPARPAAVPSPDAYEWQVSAGPDVLDYEEGDAIPAGYARDTRIRKGLVIAGAVTFGVSWLAAAGAALRFTEEREEEGRYHEPNAPPEAVLYIPLAGPWIGLGTLDPERGMAAALVVDGIAQAGGLAMLIAGVAAKRTVLVKSPGAELGVSPTAGGVRFDGKF
jgi:hypothetical protein